MTSPLAALADAFIQYYQETCGIELTFDRGSLQQVEEWMMSLPGSQAQAESEALAAMIGAYYGECLIAAYGGQWLMDKASNPAEASLFIRINEKTGIYPFAKVIDFINQGRRESILALYDAIPSILSIHNN